MRIPAVILAVCCAVSCQQNTPSIPALGFASELNKADLAVISAGLQDTIVKPLAEHRRQLMQRGYERSPLPTIVMADQTLRICDPPAWDVDCVGLQDATMVGMGPGRPAEMRSRRSFRIGQTLGPGVLVVPADELFGWIRDGPGWLERFYAKYPTPRHHGPVFFTTPVYFERGKAILYVLDFARSAHWIELSFNGGIWVVTRQIGGWIA